MDWLLEHIQVIIVVASAVAYWLNQRRREKQGLPADYDGDGVPDTKPTQTSYDPTSMEAEEAERTRRLMEEMRRKRAERSGVPLAPQAPQAPAPVSKPPVVLLAPRRLEAPPPVFHDPLAEMMKELAKRYTQLPEQEPVPSAEQEVLKRQRELEEKIRQLDAEKAATSKRAADLRKATAHQASLVPINESMASLVGSLRDPASLRKAILLNEILGKPVALR